MGKPTLEYSSHVELTKFGIAPRRKGGFTCPQTKVKQTTSHVIKDSTT